MDIDPLVVNLVQPALFDLGEPSSGTLELFPAVWGAAESLTYSDANARRAAMDRLDEMGAPRLSPLVAYMIATRLQDSDMAVRLRAIRIIGEVIAGGMSFTKENLRHASEAVRSHLTAHLAQMRTRQIYALLQASEADPGCEAYVTAILKACCFAGAHLGNILADRRVALQIRKQAAHYISRVGYLDVLPVLERLAGRLEGRVNGQQAMPFASPGKDDEIALLPLIHNVLNVLRAP